MKKETHPLWEFCKLGLLAGLTIMTIQNCRQKNNHDQPTQIANQQSAAQSCNNVTIKQDGLIYDLTKRHDRTTTISMWMTTAEPNNVYIDASDRSIAFNHKNSQILNLKRLKQHNALSGDIKKLVTCFEYAQTGQKIVHNTTPPNALRGLISPQ